MGERNQEPATTEVIDDIFERGLGELTEQDLRDELGDYDLELDDF